MTLEIKKITDKIETLKKINQTNALDLHSPYFDQSDLNNLKNCIDSTFVSTKGKFIDKFEKKITNITGAKYVVLTNSGSSATYLALRAMNIKQGTEVFIPSLNYISNANALCTLNFIPHFIESESDSFGIDIDLLEEYFKLNFTRKKNLFFNIKTGNIVSGLICTHIFGNTNNIDRVKKFCKKNQLFLIEDSSEALGSKFKTKHLGTFGDVGLLSFNGNKIITSGGGGALITDRKDIYTKARHLSQNAKLKHSWEYRYDNIGYNIVMPNLNASLGLSQAKRLNKNIIKKKKLYKFYKKFLSKFSLLKISKIDKDMKSNYWLITVLISNNSLKMRDKILNYMNKRGIRCRPIWQLLHTINVFKKYPCMQIKKAKVLEKKIINLPSSPHININEKR
jgi:perosamine synthetase